MAGVVTIPDAAERQRIRELFASTGGNISAVSRETGRDRATVRKVLLAEDDPATLPTPTDHTAPPDYEALAAWLRSRLADMAPGFPASGQFPTRESEPVQETDTPDSENGGWVDLSPPNLVRSPKLYERIVGLFDAHYPYHSVRNLDAARSFIADWRPDLVVLGGDLLDFYGLSRFDKDPARRFRIQEEIDTARPFLRWVDGLGCDVVYILGNHEDRLRRTISDNPGLHGLRALEFARMAELPERWTVLPDGSQFRTGSLTWAHGDLRGCGGGLHVAANLLRRLKTSCVFGHWHREQRFCEPGYDRTVRTAFSSGHLCDEAQADYIDSPLWTAGFVSAEIDPESGGRLFSVQQHTIHGGRFRHGGKTYSG